MPILFVLRLKLYRETTFGYKNFQLTSKASTLFSYVHTYIVYSQFHPMRSKLAMNNLASVFKPLTAYSSHETRSVSHSTGYMDKFKKYKKKNKFKENYL